MDDFSQYEWMILQGVHTPRAIASSAQCIRNTVNMKPSRGLDGMYKSLGLIREFGHVVRFV